MNMSTKPALGAAVALSTVAVGDAVLRAVSDVPPPWDPDGGTWWAQTVVDVVHGATYVLLAVLLVSRADGIDGGRGVVRWLRRALVVDLAVLGAAFLFGPPLGVMDSEPLGIVASAGFLLMFVLGTALGISVGRRPDLRLPAALMIASLVLVPLAFLPGWGHPAYAEAALYIGSALLGRAVDVAAPVPSPGRTSPHS